MTSKRGGGGAKGARAELQAANEELRAKLTEIQIELQHEKNKGAESGRGWEAERRRLLAEGAELRCARRGLEEALVAAQQEASNRAAELRSSAHRHQEELQRTRKDAERDVRRLIEEIRVKDRAVSVLDKALGLQAGHAHRLQLQTQAAQQRLRDAHRGAGPIPGPAPNTIPEERRFHLKVAELNSSIRKLEDRNALLGEERHQLLKRLKEAESQFLPLLDKNKRLSRKNEELALKLRKSQNKLAYVTMETIQKSTMRRPSSLNDLGPTPSCHQGCKQEVEFLTLQVTEQRRVIDDLSKALETAGQVKNVMERDFFLRHRRRKRTFTATRVVETFFGYDEDSADSDGSSWSTTPDDTPQQHQVREEQAEVRFRQLTQEYQALQRAYALLTSGNYDPEKELKTRQQLQQQVEHFRTRVQDLESALSQQGREVRWVEEKQTLCSRNLELLHKLREAEGAELRLRNDVQDARDQNELLEFRILELEERERRSPALSFQHIHFPEGLSPLQTYCRAQGCSELVMSDLMKQLDLLGDNANLTNEEQVLVIQARTVLSLADMWLESIEGLKASLQQNLLDIQREKEVFSRERGCLDQELDDRKHNMDHAHKRILELEAWFYEALQLREEEQGAEFKRRRRTADQEGEEPRVRGAELKAEEREELRRAVDKWRRGVRAELREADAHILRERNDVIRQQQQRLAELEEFIEAQRRQIKELEEKFLFLFLFFSLAFILWS